MTQSAEPTPPRHCSLRFSRQFLTGALRTYLAEHFADPAHIVDPALAEYGWSPDPALTRIRIESASRWDPQQADLLPALLVRADALRVQRMGINDKLQGGQLYDGQARYQTQFEGSHTIFALARSAAAAEALAEEAFYAVLEFADPLRRSLGLARLLVLGVSEVAEVGEGSAPQSYAASVTVAYSRIHSWEIRTQAPFLRRIELTPVPPAAVP